MALTAPPDLRMQKPVSLFTLTAAVIVAGWWWLGAAVPMPPSPLDPGEKLYCVSYAPFRGAQSPLDLSTKIEPAQIDQDLAQLAKVTDCVRTYSVDFGLDQVPEIAQRHGLKVLLGLWVSSHTDRTQYQISTGVALANRFPDVVRAVIVGNEALLRGEVSPAMLGRNDPWREVAGQGAGDLCRRLGVLAALSRARNAQSTSSPSISCPIGRTIRSRRGTPPTTSMRSASAWPKIFPARRS